MPEQLNDKGVNFTSMSLPRHWPFAKSFDAWGSPKFSTKRELREALAAGNANGENVHWDGRKL